MPVHRTGELCLRHAIRERERTLAEIEAGVEARDRRPLLRADAVRRAEQGKPGMITPDVTEGEPDDGVRPVEVEGAPSRARRIPELPEVAIEDVRARVRGEREARVAVPDGALGVQLRVGEVVREAAIGEDRDELVCIGATSRQRPESATVLARAADRQARRDDRDRRRAVQAWSHRFGGAYVEHAGQPAAVRGAEPTGEQLDLA